MPIVRTDSSGATEIMHSGFQNEAELELIVSAHPCLLSLPQEPKIALVKRQVNLPRAGYLDILMVNSEGLPIAVEVKLARNNESRREVVGQLIDYVSILTSFTVDELDESVTSALETALRSLTSDLEDEDDFERSWQAVGANLRAGFARYVIVVDEVREELERIVRFLVERSNLDIRLVMIQKYPDQLGQTIYVPINVVEVSDIERTAIAAVKTDIPLDLQAVLDAYKAKCDPQFPMIGQGRTYRIVRPYTWAPSLGIHYEFYKISTGITAELHLESEAVCSLTSILQNYPEQKKSNFKYALRWDKNWHRGKGKLIVSLPAGSNPEIIADAMCELIKLTYEDITPMLALLSNTSDNNAINAVASI